MNFLQKWYSLAKKFVEEYWIEIAIVLTFIAAVLWIVIGVEMTSDN